MSNTAVAQEILTQLGGNKFIVMTGAKNLSSHFNALMFKMSSTITKNKCNYVQISLNGNDLYDVTFSKIVKFEVKEISKYTDVFCADLVDLFEAETGLCTKLF